MKRLENIFFVIIVFLLFFDLGNLDAIRQGTEGFYLLISQEMYEAKDLLTPRIYGDYHWSKPPLQFIFPMPFFKIFGGSYLYWARFSILAFSLLSTGLMAKWYQDNLKRNWWEAFCFLLIPIYFIKYSRIFMMEMTLSYLITLGGLYFYSYLTTNQRKSSLFLASLFSGLSVLIKGPVSLAILYPSMGLFTLKNKSKVHKAFLFGILSFLIGSIWFLLSYIRFGDDFFNYFFIRENLGKFTAKSYPISSVIQGLLIYSFPLPLFLGMILLKTQKAELKKPFSYFSLLFFSFLYFIWFFPKQKSHHYAVPAIPILSIFSSYYFFRLKDIYQKKFLTLLTYLYDLIVLICMIFLLVFWYFKDDLNFLERSLIFNGALFCIVLWSHIRSFQTGKLRIFKFILPLILLWQFILPLGILPVVPNKVQELANKDKTLFIWYRKPFFIQEAVSADTKIISQEGLSSPDIKVGNLVFMSLSDYQSSANRDAFSILHKWNAWKRGSGVSHISHAIEKRKLDTLQESYVLIIRNR